MASCGDGIQNANEACDDGNNIDGDGCSSTCTLGYCGDGVVDDGEACDDGNGDDGDGCRSDCTVPTCGDGVVDAGEECDSSEGCGEDCTLPFCGDGELNTGEECDDGNDQDGDGCDTQCKIEHDCVLKLEKACVIRKVTPPPASGDICDGKLTALTFEYTGSGCAGTTNQQSGKVSCQGGSAAAPVKVVATGKKGKNIWSSTSGVNVGDRVAVSAGGDKLDSDTTLSVTGGESVTFHSSCSKPIHLGDQFGSFRLVGFLTTTGAQGEIPAQTDGGDGEEEVSENCQVQRSPGQTTTVRFRYRVTNPNSFPVRVTVEDELLGSIVEGTVIGANGEEDFFKPFEVVESVQSSATVTGFVEGDQGELCADDSAGSGVIVKNPPPQRRDCSDGKPRGLVFEYTGEACSATTNWQSGKAECSGVPSPVEGVQFVASGGVVFSAPADAKVGDHITMSSGDGGKLDSQTDITIRGTAGVQELSIHTSCSKNLELGDQFGALKVVDMIPVEGDKGNKSKKKKDKKKKGKKKKGKKKKGKKKK